MCTRGGRGHTQNRVPTAVCRRLQTPSLPSCGSLTGPDTRATLSTVRVEVQAFVASPLTPFSGLCTPDSHVVHLRGGEGRGLPPGIVPSWKALAWAAGTSLAWAMGQGPPILSVATGAVAES